MVYTVHITPSAVTPPQETLRYLGGWLSPIGNWFTAKAKLLADVHKILTVLKHKQLPLKQFQYTIKLRSRGQTPLRHVHSPHDRQRTQCHRQPDCSSIQEPHATSTLTSLSPLLFMHTRGMGAGLSSVRDMRDTMLIEAAHMLLNDRNSTQYEFAYTAGSSLCVTN